MPKTTWNELIAQFPSPHLVVALLPDETPFTARAAQQLMVRLLKKLPTHGEYAVTISRQSGEHEIVCGFGHISDASLAARTTASQFHETGMRYSFILDESAGRKLLKVAGLPEKQRQPRTTPHARWQS